MEHFDLLVIGGGPGGYLCAQRAAQGGMTVCLFEARHMGGTCLNEGCIPTKTLLNSVKLYRLVENFRLRNCVVARSCVKNKEFIKIRIRALPFHHARHLFKLFHKMRLDVKSARSVYNYNVRTLCLCRGKRIENNRGGVAALLVLDYAHLCPFRPDGKLVCRRRAEGIRRRHGNCFALP